MPFLLDTNILLRFIDPNASEYVLIRAAVRTLTARGKSLCFASQNLVEFWNVCTRPVSVNGLGLTPEQTDARARLIESQFLVSAGHDRVHAEWRRLVVHYKVVGVKVRDAQFAAAMLSIA